MQPNDLQRFNHAVALAQAGQKQEAFNLLSDLMMSYPDESNLLLWFAFTAPDLTQARSALERAAWLDPANPSLPGAQSWLAQQQPVPPAAPVPVFAPAATYRSFSPDAPPASPAQNFSSSRPQPGGNSQPNASSWPGSGYSAASSYWPAQYAMQRPGYFTRLGMGWEFFKQAIAMLQKDANLLKPSLYAIAVNALVLVVGAGLIIAALLFLPAPRGRTNDNLGPVIGVVGALIVFFNFLVNYYFSATTIHLVYQHLQTGRSSMAEARRAAGRGAGAIIGVALVSTLISLIRSQIDRERGGIGGLLTGLLAGIVEAVWTMATYFVLPAIVIENMGLGASLKRATYIIKNNLLQVGVGYVGLGFATAIISFLGFVATIVPALLLFLALYKVNLILAVVLVLGLIFMYSALVGAFTSYLKSAYYTCLYTWALDNERAGGFAPAPAPLRQALHPIAAG